MKRRSAFGEKVSRLMMERGMSQADLADAIGVARSTLTCWMTGSRNPQPSGMRKIADMFNVPVSLLLDDSEPLVYTRTVCNKEPSPVRLKTTSQTEMVISDDTMSPRLRPGDTVIAVDEDCKTGDMVIATYKGSDPMCRRIRFYEHGIGLIPENWSYEELYIDDIGEAEFEIIGKVIEIRSRP